MNESLQLMIESATSEVARKYAQIFEAQIHEALKRHLGEVPHPDQIREHALMVKVRYGKDCYDELQYDKIPLFRQRVKFEKSAVWIEVEKC